MDSYPTVPSVAASEAGGHSLQAAGPAAHQGTVRCSGGLGGGWEARFAQSYHNMASTSEIPDATVTLPIPTIPEQHIQPGGTATLKKKKTVASLSPH